MRITILVRKCISAEVCSLRVLLQGAPTKKNNPCKKFHISEIVTHFHQICSGYSGGSIVTYRMSFKHYFVRLCLNLILHFWNWTSV